MTIIDDIFEVMSFLFDYRLLKAIIFILIHSFSSLQINPNNNNMKQVTPYVYIIIVIGTDNDFLFFYNIAIILYYIYVILYYIVVTINKMNHQANPNSLHKFVISQVFLVYF
jgi:hypothetical protein